MKEKVFSFLWMKICSKHMRQDPSTSLPTLSFSPWASRMWPTIGLGSVFIGVFCISPTECGNEKEHAI